jgi:hypothetical protein
LENNLEDFASEDAADLRISRRDKKIPYQIIAEAKVLI